MSKRSAGILLYRYRDTKLEVFVVHPGGPFWAGKDEHAWSIPKGEYEDDENPQAAARRELREETGVVLRASLIDLGEIRQSCGKRVRAWAAHQDCDADTIESNTFTMEWPPHSGQMREFPEVDQAAWVAADAAPGKLHQGQGEFIARLRRKLDLAAPPESPG